jgi:hypothetical protein
VIRSVPQSQLSQRSISSPLSFLWHTSQGSCAKKIYDGSKHPTRESGFSSVHTSEESMSSSFADSVVATRLAAFLPPAITKSKGREKSAAILDQLIEPTNVSSVRMWSMHDPFDDEGHSRLALPSPQNHPAAPRADSMIPSEDYREDSCFRHSPAFQKQTRLQTTGASAYSYGCAVVSHHVVP